MEAKFREVRELIAESRRLRGSLASIQRPEHNDTEAEDGFVHDPVLSMAPSSDHRESLVSITSFTQPSTEPMVMPKAVSTLAQSSLKLRSSSHGSSTNNRPKLADTKEVKVAEDFTLFLAYYDSCPQPTVTPFTTNVISENLKPEVAGPAGIPLIQQNTPTGRTLLSKPGMTIDPLATVSAPSLAVSPVDHLSSVPPALATVTTAVFAQSCPASIHTTPIPAHVSLQQAGVDEWQLFFGHQDHQLPKDTPGAQVDANHIPQPLPQPYSLQSLVPPPIQRGSLGSFDAPRDALMYNGTSADPWSQMSACESPIWPSENVLRYPPALSMSNQSQSQSQSQQYRSLSDSSMATNTVSPVNLVGRDDSLDSDMIWPPRTSIISPMPPAASSVVDLMIPPLFGKRSFSLTPGPVVPLPQTIDPRWVSPISSLHSTPAQTPRFQLSDPFDSASQISQAQLIDICPQQPSNLGDTSADSRCGLLEADAKFLTQFPRDSDDEQPNICEGTAGSGSAIQQVRSPSNRFGTQSYPPGLGMRKKMKIQGSVPMA